MLVDAEDDQDEFRGDARKDDADDDAGDRGQQRMKPPNGLIAIAAKPEKMPEMPNSTISAITSQ